MLTFEAALALIAEAVRPLPAETVPLALAHRRRLAAPAHAMIDSPRTAVSTMDGYAVMPDDAGPSWIVTGVSYPGEPFEGALVPGATVRIFTGAPLPDGGGRVILQENVVRTGDAVTLTTQPEPYMWVRAAASDFAAGDLLLPAGHRIDDRALLGLAGGDVGSVMASRVPRISLIATGSELVAAGTASHRASAVPDSISPALAAFVDGWGGKLVSSSQLADDPVALTSAAQTALGDADLIIITGGASVGERDYARPVWEALGLELLFAKVAIKPGKPVWMGQIDGRWVVGLPGNPTSALVTARLFLAPLLMALNGARVEDALCWRSARLDGDIPSTGDRDIFHRARRNADDSVTPLSNQDSGAQAALARADCLIRTMAGQSARADGANVATLDWYAHRSVTLN
jgi:molybdopterin molybdotransferase